MRQPRIWTLAQSFPLASRYDRYRRTRPLLKPFALAGPVALIRLSWARSRGRIQLGDAAGWLLASAGVWCLLASLTIWGLFTIKQQRDGEEVAERLIASFTDHEELSEQQAAIEAEAE